MSFPTGYAPGWSDLAVPVSEEDRRARVKVRPPRAALEEARRRAARFRRAVRRVEPAAAAATGGRSAAKLSKEERLVRRATMGWTLVEQARVEEIGYAAYLEEQLDYESLDDSALEEALAEALPTLALSPAQIYQRYRDEPFQPILELLVATFLRAVYSPRQLFERMAVFWSDHFNIHIFAGFGYLLKPTDDREVVRRHALGSFPELLSASAHSPAMLSYLTNDSNVAGHPNENYARELMELHTLGVDNGYTEKDVKEVARCFTGWTFFGRFGGPQLGRFRFDAASHDSGRKRVLGQRIKSGGGVEDGERVLEILAGHPGTAEFLAEKLLRHFWGYQPKRSAIDKVADAYAASGGDLREMLRVVLSKGRMRKAKEKIKRPQYLFASTFRALFAELGDVGAVLRQLNTAGHLPYGWPAPNGYPDSEAYWSGFVLPRWNFAATLLGPGGGADLGDLVRPDWQPRRIVDTLDDHLLNGRMTKATRKEIEKFLGKGRQDARRVADAIGLAAASPEFQRY